MPAIFLTTQAYCIRSSKNRFHTSSFPWPFCRRVVHRTSQPLLHSGLPRIFCLSYQKRACCIQPILNMSDHTISIFSFSVFLSVHDPRRLCQFTETLLCVHSMNHRYKSITNAAYYAIHLPLTQTLPAANQHKTGTGVAYVHAWCDLVRTPFPSVLRHSLLC